MTTRFNEPHDEELEEIVRALETAPPIEVPADFAARVMARVPAASRRTTLQRARALTPRYGRTAAFCGLGVLLIAMVVITREAGTSAVWTALQLLLLVQLCTYALWIGLASWRSR